MAEVIELLGENLCGEKDSTLKTESLCGTGKVIGLYFSAHWCPPCRGFTPELAKFYKTVKDSANGDRFDIVFVSSDRDEASFKDYFGEMPWKALPYSDRDRKGSISKKYKVSGIPTLIFISGEDGRTLNKDGRSVVAEDPEAKNFPWTEKSFKEIFTGEVLTSSKDGTKSTIEEATRGKIVGLYFSAHWCPPCKAFTPALVETYNALKSQGKNFEVLFLSSDRSQESFDEYYGEMPWLALPYNDPRKKSLARLFEIQGIPSLILLDEDQDVITANGRAAVMGDKKGEKFPWVPEPLLGLTGATVAQVNENSSLIFLTAGKPENITLARDAMLEMATAHQQQVRARKKAKQEVTDEVVYFYENEEEDSEETADSLRNFLNLEDRSPLVLFLDIPNGNKFVLPESEAPTKARLQQVVSDFQAGKLTMVPMRS